MANSLYYVELIIKIPQQKAALIESVFHFFNFFLPETDPSILPKLRRHPSKLKECRLERNVFQKKVGENVQIKTLKIEVREICVCFHVFVFK